MMWSHSIVYPSVAFAQQTMPNARSISSFFSRFVCCRILCFSSSQWCVCVCICVHTPRGGILLRRKIWVKRNVIIENTHQQQQNTDTHTHQKALSSSLRPLCLCVATLRKRWEWPNEGSVCGGKEKRKREGAPVDLLKSESTQFVVLRYLCRFAFLWFVSLPHFV